MLSHPTIFWPCFIVAGALERGAVGLLPPVTIFFFNFLFSSPPALETTLLLPFNIMPMVLAQISLRFFSANP